MIQWETRDYHVGGEAVRVFEGIQPIPGATMLEKRQVLRADRRIPLTIREPRGHAGMYAAVLTEPAQPSSVMGVLFACNTNCYPMFCGHALLGAVRGAVEMGIISTISDGENRFNVDAPSGSVEAIVRIQNGSVSEVSFVNQPCIVLAQSVQIPTARHGILAVDIVWAGSFMAYVSADALSDTLSEAVIPEALALGYEIEKALMNMRPGFVHPLNPGLKLEFSGALVCFVTQAEEDGDRITASTLNIIDRNNFDRGAAGTGTCGRLALLHRRGKARIGQTLYNYALTGQHYDATLLSVCRVADREAIVPELTAQVYPMSQSTFLAQGNDPFPEGF